MMNKLEIINFQSHRNTILEFHSGVNVIIGESCKGKSVILRALEWIIFNRINGKLSGYANISHWNINNKNNIFEDTLCRVFIDNNIIERKKTNDFNGYIINGKELKAIGSDVPFEVSKIFNFSDVNIQAQFDRPFLLSESSGEVARFFNNIIKIDDIDKVLTLTESKKRKSKTDLKYIEKDLEKIKKDLKELEWIDKVDILLRKADRINKNIEKNEKTRDDLKELLDRKEKIEFNINRIDINKLKVLFNQVNDLNNEIEKQEKIFFDLKKLVDRYDFLNERINKYDKIKHIKNYFEKIDEINNELKDLEKEKNDLGLLVSKYENIRIEKKNNLIELEEIRKILPDMCPVCNQPIKEELL